MPDTIVDSSVGCKILPPPASFDPNWIHTTQPQAASTVTSAHIVEYVTGACITGPAAAPDSSAAPFYYCCAPPYYLTERDYYDYMRRRIVTFLHIWPGPLVLPATSCSPNAPVNLPEICLRAEQVLQVGFNRGLYSHNDYAGNVQHLRECTQFAMETYVFQELPCGYAGSFAVAGSGNIREEYILLEAQVALLYWQSDSYHGKQARYLSSLGMFRRALRHVVHQKESSAMTKAAQASQAARKDCAEVSVLPAVKTTPESSALEEVTNPGASMRADAPEAPEVSEATESLQELSDSSVPALSSCPDSSSDLSPVSSYLPTRSASPLQVSRPSQVETEEMKTLGPSTGPQRGISIMEKLQQLVLEIGKENMEGQKEAATCKHKTAKIWRCASEKNATSPELLANAESSGKKKDEG